MDIRSDMDRDTAERKADKRMNLEAEYEAKLRVLLEEIEKAGGESQDSALEARRSQLRRLTQLITKKTNIERKLASTTSELLDRYEQMEQELITAVEGRMQDTTDAEKILEEILKVGQEVRGQNSADKAGVHGDGDGDGREQSEHHAGGDHATQDPKGIIRDVPVKEQVKRAEDMARRGRRV